MSDISCCTNTAHVFPCPVELIGVEAGIATGHGVEVV